MELYAADLHFIGNGPKAQNYDYCVHGKVIFKIDAAYKTSCILNKLITY